MSVAAQDDLRIIALKEIKHDVPVGNAVINRVMRDEDDWLVRIRQLCEGFLQPAHVLGRPVAIAHFHQRPLVQTDEAETALFENEAVRRPEPRKIRRSGLRPLGVVISRQNVVRQLQLIQRLLCPLKLLAGTVLRHIAGDHHEA